MGTTRTQSAFRPVALVLASASLLGLVGCGAGGFSQEGVASNDFLNRIQQNCGKLTVGHQPIGWLLSASSTDTTFVDAASKLYSGQFSKADFEGYLSSFYPGGTSQATLDCIYGQL
ncbi:MAG: hypothetical protein ACM3ST_04895 [Bdellovibrio bacteriovorus]